MTWQDSYLLPVAATTPTGEYSTTPAAFAPTTTPSPDRNFYQSDRVVTVTTTAIAYSNGDENFVCTARTSGPTRDQRAIIALGIVCGLLIIGFAAFLVFLCYQRRQDSTQMEGGLVISPGYQAIGRHKHHGDQSGSSKGDTDEMTDYLPGLKGYSASKKRRSHRRSQPVTREDFERLQKRTNPGAQRGRTGYAQFGNAGLPMYFQSRNGDAQPAPIIQVPLPTRARQPQRDVEEVMSEVCSSNHGGHPQHRQSPIARQHSKSLSSIG